MAQSLLLSKELYGAGSWPILNRGESQRSHSNVMGVYRSALSENFAAMSNDSSEVMLSDYDLVQVYELVPPSSLVRMVRLCLSIRISIKGNVELFALLFAAWGGLAIMVDGSCVRLTMASLL